MNEVNEGESTSLPAAGGPFPGPRPTPHGVAMMRQAETALLNAFGCTVLPVTLRDRDGKMTEGVQVFAESDVYDRVLAWADKAQLSFPLMVFEMDPSPF